MAITSFETETPGDKKTKEDQESDLLVRLAKIYAFVKSRELTKTLSSFTFDDYIDLAKTEIKSETETLRPTKLQQLDRLEEEINKAISQAKQLK